MSFIEWKAEWMLGIDEIDAQHQEWLGILNDLYEAMASGTDKEKLGVILDRLICYCGWHFSAEERIMRAAGYPGLTKHQEGHNQLTSRVFSVQVRFEHGMELGLSVDTLSLLRDWITGHILVTDMRFARFLKTGIYEDGETPAAVVAAE